MLKKHISIAAILLLLELFAIITFINYPINQVLELATRTLNWIVIYAILHYSIQQMRQKKSFLNLNDLINSLIPGTLIAVTVSYIVMKMFFSPL